MKAGDTGGKVKDKQQGYGCSRFHVRKVRKREGVNMLYFFAVKCLYLSSILGNGAVAQLVEQRTENPCVGGSIPPHTTFKE